MSPASATILVCDDEAAIRELVRAALARDEYTIIEAGDGEQALQMARDHRPEVIVLDLSMPRRSGLEVLVQLRDDPQFDDTAVIVLTARTQAADIDAVTAAGADRYLAKPFNLAAFVATVEDALVRAPRTSADERSAAE